MVHLAICSSPENQKSSFQLFIYSETSVKGSQQDTMAMEVRIAHGYEIIKRIGNYLSMPCHFNFIWLTSHIFAYTTCFVNCSFVLKTNIGSNRYRELMIFA